MVFGFYNKQASDWLSMHSFKIIVDIEPAHIIYGPYFAALARWVWLALVVEVSYNTRDFKLIFLVAGVVDWYGLTLGINNAYTSASKRRFTHRAQFRKG